MTTPITKEQLIEKLKHRISVTEKYPDVEEAQLDATIFKLALSAMDAEPVAWLLSGGGAKNVVCFDSGNAYADPLREVTPLYRHAPPAPIVLDGRQSRSAFEKWCAVNIERNKWHPWFYAHLPAREQWAAWEACRDAMLNHSGDTNEKDHSEDALDMVEPVSQPYKLNSPVIPDSSDWTNAQCLEFLTVAFRHNEIAGDIEFDDIRLGVKFALAAAPQQEGK